MRRLVLIAFLLAAPPVFAANETRLANAIAVIVNDAIITYEEIEALSAPAVELYQRQFARQPELMQQKITDARAEATEQLVERQLILHDWKTSGYNLPESIIEDAVKERIRERFGDNLTFTKTLQAQGVTKEQFREKVREEIIVGALRAKNIGSELIISPQKIEAYYAANRDKFKVDDQVKLRMIVINKKPGDTNSPARALMEEVRRKIKEGAAFAEMAAIYSEGSQRSQGGDWGWVDRSVPRKELAEVAFSLQAGQLSDIVELADACYLMLVEQAKPAHIKPLADVRDEIEKTLLAQERARLQKRYVEKLKAKSFVRYF
jgi:parvulin-like peptidyl-prolyl isomerase